MPMLLAAAGMLVGEISLRDEIRPEDPEVLTRLRIKGVRPDTAEVVAGELGIDQCGAPVMQQHKLTVVRERQDECYVVRLVGGGVIDASAPARVDLTMGPCETDVAVESADLTLAIDNLRRVPGVPDLGAQAVEATRHNCGMSPRSTPPDCSSVPAERCRPYWPRSCTTRLRWRWSVTARASSDIGSPLGGCSRHRLMATSQNWRQPVANSSSGSPIRRSSSEKHRSRRSAGCSTLALMCAVLAIALAPRAAADPTDDAFIAALQRHGIPVADPSRAIGIAHTLCSDLDSGQSRTSLVLPLARAANLTAHEAAYFLGAAVASYCPD